jgi:hypothetical protein
MSIQAIRKFHNAIHKIYQFSGHNYELAIKDPANNPLNKYDAIIVRVKNGY